tara:strand:+ start:88 stop:741 length:654 start_codon:yes stop_codon:yes gene_type:complete
MNTQLVISLLENKLDFTKSQKKNFRSTIRKNDKEHLLTQLAYKFADNLFNNNNNNNNNRIDEVVPIIKTETKIIYKTDKSLQSKYDKLLAQHNSVLKENKQLLEDKEYEDSMNKDCDDKHIKEIEEYKLKSDAKYSEIELLQKKIDNIKIKGLYTYIDAIDNKGNKIKKEVDILDIMNKDINQFDIEVDLSDDDDDDIYSSEEEEDNIIKDLNKDLV